MGRWRVARALADVVVDWVSNEGAQHPWCLRFWCRGSRFVRSFSCQTLGDWNFAAEIDRKPRSGSRGDPFRAVFAVQRLGLPGRSSFRCVVSRETWWASVPTHLPRGQCWWCSPRLAWRNRSSGSDICAIHRIFRQALSREAAWRMSNRQDNGLDASYMGWRFRVHAGMGRCWI